MEDKPIKKGKVKTPEEIFIEMSEKNKNLLALQKAFNLTLI